MYLKQGVKKVTNERERERERERVFISSSSMDTQFAHLLTCDCLLTQGLTVFSEK